MTVFEASERWRSGDLVGLRFCCSSGTYVRSLVAGLGDAYCVELRRTAIGPFAAEGAWPGEGVARVVDVPAAWARFGSVIELGEQEAEAAAHGRRIAGRGLDGPALLVDGAGAALAVVSEHGGLLRVEVGLRP